jgi:hypothetical protein
LIACFSTENTLSNKTVLNIETGICSYNFNFPKRITCEFMAIMQFVYKPNWAFDINFFTYYEKINLTKKTYIMENPTGFKVIAQF